MKKLYILLMAGLISACSDVTDVENNIPDVTTGDVTDVGARQATIEYTGSLDQGYYYLELSTSSTFMEGVTINIAHPTGLQWQTTGLMPGTTYYYRQCATDGLTTVNGQTKQFTTKPLVNISSINLHPWNEPVALEHLSADTELGIYYSNAATNNDYKGLSNFRPTYTDGHWLMPFDIEPSTDSYIFYAYAPYSTNATDKTRIPVSTREKNIDYLCGSSIMVTATQCNADITMRHALAHVIFSVKKDESNNTDFSVARYGFWLKDKGIPLECTLDITTSDIKVTYSNEGMQRSLTVAHTLTTTAVDLDFYVIPFNFGNNQMQFELYGNANNYTNMKSVTVPQASWQAGMEYRYEVTVKHSTLEISDVEVNPWTEHTGYDIIINN